MYIIYIIYYILYICMYIIYMYVYYIFYIYIIIYIHIFAPETISNVFFFMLSLHYYNSGAC